MEITIIDALISLRPKAEWILDGNTYAGLKWLDESQTKPTEVEVNNKIAELEVAEPAKQVREIRNRLLAESDWTQLKDIDLDIIRERNWKNYRQALRDLPSKSNPKLDGSGKLDASSITWPTKPSS